MKLLLLRLFTLRHWRRAPRTTLLLLFTLALGVAVYLSIRMANRAALAGFASFTELVNAESDFIIQASAGSLPESALVETREAMGNYFARCIPVLETTAATPRAKGEPGGLKQRESFTLYGLDLVALQNLRVGGRDKPDEKAVRWLGTLGKPNAVYISRALAEKRQLQQGSVLPLIVQDRTLTLEVGGVMPDREDIAQVPETLLLMDLPALQVIAARQDTLDRIEVLVEKGALAEADRGNIKEALEKLCEGRWRLTTPNERRDAASLMTRAFRWNLGVLSLLALLVGLYLVFQALDGAVVRRREEIGVLRSLGVEPAAIQAAWLLESCLLGLGGGLLGAALGWAGAQGAVQLVAQTVNSLYHSTHAQTVNLTGGDVLLAVGLGVGSSLLAGGWPARQAALTPPAQLMTRHLPQPLGSTRWRKVWPALMLLTLAVVLSFLPPLRLEGGGRFALAGYVAALVAVLGGGLLAGNGLQFLAVLMKPLTHASQNIRMATSHLRRASSRHRLAVAALVCAVAMTSGMAILVGSFEKTMQGWIVRTFQADLYVSSDGAQTATSQNRILPETLQAIAALPEMAEVNGICFMPIELPEGEILLAAGDMTFMQRHVDMAWMQAPQDDALYDHQRNAALCLVSESFSERFRQGRGDVVSIPTPAGNKSLTIAGVYSDYGNDRGTITVDRQHYRQWFQDETVSRLVLMVKPGADAEAVRADLLQRHPGLMVFTNAHLRSEVLRIFRQTFAITHALELIGVIVAVIGLGMTLASVLLERRDELTTLRALGMTCEEVARATMIEGLLLALAGAVGGLIVSLGLGWLLVFVINKQTFGWTLQFSLPWFPMLGLLLLVLLSAAMVSWSVGRWGADLPADREE